MDNNYNKIKIENEDKEKENVYLEILNKLNKSKVNNININKVNNNNNNNLNLKNKKNFSQQVDFLYHRDNPEGSSSIKNILIKQYKKKKKLPNSKTEEKIKKKKIIPYSNKNKGLFDPYLTEKELDYESNIKKQREEREKKIAEYEKYKKNKNHQKLKKNLNKQILNINPTFNSKINPKNFIKKKFQKKDQDLIKHFVQIPKPKINKKYSDNFGFNPKKYDMIINSLINEINEVKNKRQKEKNEIIFRQKIENYMKKNVDKYDNYYEYIYKNQKNNLNFGKKNKTEKKINNNQPTRAQIIKDLMQNFFGKDNNKNVDINEIEENKDINNINKSINIQQYYNHSNKNNNNKNNILLYEDITSEENNNEINFDNLDKLLSSEKLNFQDKINIISELNKNIDNYAKAMPYLINKVQNSLNKIYENNPSDILFRKEINKIPYIAMASKTAFQLIQTNNDYIIEKIIDELLYESAIEINNINTKKNYLRKKYDLINKCNLTQNNINELIGKENEIFEKNKKIVEENKNNINNEQNKIKKKLVITKFKAELDDDIINKEVKYKNEFKEYMIFKGSFYADNIFKVYDEFVYEEADNLLSDVVDKFVHDLNNNDLDNKNDNNEN